MHTAVGSQTVRRRWWWGLWGVLLGSAVGIAVFSVPPYLAGGTTVPGLDMTIPGYYTSLVVHALPAGLALVIGPWQFVPALRTRFPQAHRTAGRVYLVSVVVAALAAPTVKWETLEKLLSALR